MNSLPGQTAGNDRAGSLPLLLRKDYALARDQRLDRHQTQVRLFCFVVPGSVDLSKALRQLS